ncbi:MAG: Rne/Rng family ribonuclease [Solirubrobacteraceae bacterium]|nr:Rne/Rng family ribonuclease [Solirubrobacteraceae bacterium]
MKKQVLVSADRGETRVALLERTPNAPKRRRKNDPADGFQVAELYFERRGARSIVGNVYKGKVDNVLPGLEAAFVDIGLEKNGFLHVDEIVLPGVEQVKRGRGPANGPKITDLLRPGQEITVQVIKDPLKSKGARLSMELTIAGRYLVYAPTGEGTGVSKRLEDKERERLRKEIRGLDTGGGGVIVRTAAHGATRDGFEREMLYLKKLHEVLQGRVEKVVAPGLVFQEADLAVRVVRDIFADDFEKALIDDDAQYERLKGFLQRTAPELVDKVERYKGRRPLLEEYSVDEEIDSLLERRVDLPSGGYLIIDYAEALTVIDVNSGSFVGKGKQARLEDTITKINLEAAEEVVRQLRLRDIGGIIVIDFIDMARAKNRDAVLKTLRGALEQDRTKTYTAELSKLGLVEMTRQNVTEGVREIITKPCPTCHGEGVVRSEETIALDHERALREIARKSRKSDEAFLIQMNPRVSQIFTGEGGYVLRALEEHTGKRFHFEGSEGLPLSHLEVLMTGTRDEVGERAIPFREGDEVLVHIVEPHMYDMDRAVAKIDGYIVSVAGAGKLIGEKRLVRIESAGRTSADAVLADGPEAAASAASSAARRQRKALNDPPARGEGVAEGGSRRPSAALAKAKADAAAGAVAVVEESEAPADAADAAEPPVEEVAAEAASPKKAPARRRSTRAKTPPAGQNEAAESGLVAGGDEPAAGEPTAAEAPATPAAAPVDTDANTLTDAGSAGADEETDTADGDAVDSSAPRRRRLRRRTPASRGRTKSSES